MGKFERTACCPKCGSVLLKVIPGLSKVDYACSECNQYVATVDYAEYETLNSECEKCSNDTFKVRVTEDEKSKSWTPFCSKCNEQGSRHYADKEGMRIDEETRENLIIKDTITNLIEEVYSLESNLKDVEDTADYIEESDLYEAFTTLKVQIRSCSDDIFNINDLLLKLARKFNVVEE